MLASLYFSPSFAAKRLLGVTFHIAVVVVLGTLNGGCASMDDERRQRVLTFFFTGVPSLEEHKSDNAGSPSELIAQDHLVKQERRRNALLARPTEPWTHGPVGANRCGSCHAVRAGEGLRSAGLSMAPMQLSAPIDKLCVTCHEHQGPAMADARGLHLHAPVGAGRCDLCHGAHSGPRRYQLKGESDRGLCTQCHEETALRSNRAHESEQLDCTACHNPHLGTNRWLLRSDFDETVDNYTR